MAHPDVDLPEALAPHRVAALDHWRRLVFDSYPEEAVRFFRGETDRFKNPVGQTILQATGTLFDGALMGEGSEGVPEALEALVSIRAVQDFSPAEAVGVVFQLKRAVRETLEAVTSEPLSAPLLSDLDARVDALALSAFELYTRCRERVFEIRVREARRRTAGLLRRFNREGRSEQRTEGAPGGGAEHRGKGVLA